MQDYFEEQEYFLNRIWFPYDGCLYEGNGIMTWNPESGFHIAGKDNGLKLFCETSFLRLYDFSPRWFSKSSAIFSSSVYKLVTIIDNYSFLNKGFTFCQNWCCVIDIIVFLCQPTHFHME